MRHLIIGAGYFGQNLALCLVKKGQEVIIIDKNMNKLTPLRDIVSKAIQADATDKETLKKIIPSGIDQAVVSIGRSIEANLIVSLLLKEIGLKNIVSKCHSPEHKKILKMIGVNTIIDPEQEMAEFLANKLVDPDILDYLPIESGYKVVKAKAPAALAGKMLKDLDVRKKFAINIIGLKQKRKDGSFTFDMTPGGNTVISEGDMVIAIGKESDLESLF